MKTIALRFSDKFAPLSGTIAEHRKVISEKGFVWYGKLGTPVSDRICAELLKNEKPRILLIHSGKVARYWVYINMILKETPPLNEIPTYYRNQANNFQTWFRVVRIEDADKRVMAACTVSSSGASVSAVSRISMSPYFIIEYSEDKYI